jgi:hypothetical protein
MDDAGYIAARRYAYRELGRSMREDGRRAFALTVPYAAQARRSRDDRDARPCVSAS